jgi:hypothetical protein
MFEATFIDLYFGSDQFDLRLIVTEIFTLYSGEYQSLFSNTDVSCLYKYLTKLLPHLHMTRKIIAYNF